MREIEVSIDVDRPGRHLSFNQDEAVISNDPDVNRVRALRLLESAYADARAALLAERPAGG